MKSYTIVKTGGKIDWDSIPVMKIDHKQWEVPTEITAQSQICWDEEGFHVRLRAYEKNIRAKHKGTLSMVCEDSCLEFFIRPLEDSLRYFNSEWNPNTALYLGFGTGMDDLTRLIVSDKKAIFAPKAEYTADGWQITFRVPFSYINIFLPEFKPATGTKLFGNCYKCGDLTESVHYLTWNALPAEPMTFHNPAFYGQWIMG